MNYVFIPASQEGFFYCVASEMPSEQIKYYFGVGGTQRRFSDYVEPESPLFRAGVVQRNINGGWFASSPNPMIDDINTESLEECKLRLVQEGSLGAAIELSKIDRKSRSGQN
jgi:hypothetical protein